MDVPNATIQLHHASSRDCKKCKTTDMEIAFCSILKLQHFRLGSSALESALLGISGDYGEVIKRSSRMVSPS
jgi:hypothetical protein